MTLNKLPDTITGKTSIKHLGIYPFTQKRGKLHSEVMWETRPKYLAEFMTVYDLGLDEEICKSCDSIRDKEINQLKEENKKLKQLTKFYKDEIKSLEFKAALHEEAVSIKEIAEEFTSSPEGKKAWDDAWEDRAKELKELVEQGKMSRIKFYRLLSGVDQKTLAGKLGTKQPNITRIEKPGYQPNVDTLKKLAKILGVKMEDLIER